MGKLIRFIPKRLRHGLYRKAANSYSLGSDDVIFKIAETQDELEQAFRINSKNGELKLNKHHVLPTSKVLVAVKNSKIVATLSVSLESPVRTFCDEQFDLGSLKTQNKRFVELSDFEVDPNYNKEFKSFLFPLCKFAFELNKLYFKADHVVSAVRAEDFDYWSSIFLFEKLVEKTANKNTSKTINQVVCVFAEFKGLEEKFLRRYGSRKSENNLYQYLFIKRDSRFQRPAIANILKQKYSPQILNYFFNIKTDLFAHFTSFEAKTIQKIYDEQEYEHILPAGSKTRFENQRNVKRYHAHLTGQLMKENSLGFSIVIKTVSLRGLGAICSEKLSNESTYQMKVDIGEKVQIDLLVSPVWSSRDQTYGFVIRNQSADWTNFIENFYDQEKQAS